MKTILVEIGNSDDKLTQQKWASYCAEVRHAIANHSQQTFSSFFSSTDAPWQNAGWHFEIMDKDAESLQQSLLEIGGRYRQQYVAWSETQTTMLEPR